MKKEEALERLENAEREIEACKQILNGSNSPLTFADLDIGEEFIDEEHDLSGGLAPLLSIKVSDDKEVYLNPPKSRLVFADVNPKKEVRRRVIATKVPPNYICRIC